VGEDERLAHLVEFLIGDDAGGELVGLGGLLFSSTLLSLESSALMSGRVVTANTAARRVGRRCRAIMVRGFL
jgi:hypothetical protein